MSDEKQEFIHEADRVVESKEEQPQEISIMDILQMELRRHMEIALEYQKKIAEAKTDYKKNYYKKKLKKNNTEALKVLTAIERVKKNKTNLSPKMEPDITNIEYTDEEVKTVDENIVA